MKKTLKVALLTCLLLLVSTLMFTACNNVAENNQQATSAINEETTPPALHVHTEEILEGKAPTCTQPGLGEGKYCSACNEILVAQETLKALGHDEQSHEAKNPTCSEIGWDAYVTCSRCEYTTYAEKAALGHNYEWVVDTQPTLEAEGVKHEECAVCHDKRNENTPIDKLTCTHNLTKTAATDATCLTAGNKEYYTCSICNKVYSNAAGTLETTPEDCIIAALGHNKQSHEAKNPTCAEIGWDAYVTCSRCKYTTYIEKAALGHKWADATCTAPKTCSVCKTTEGQTLEHAISNTGVCTVCGKSFILSVEEAIEIGMSYEKEKYSSEYYYVTLTLDNQVNDTGFARAKIAEGLYVSVSNPSNYVAGTLKLGDTVIYKAKLGAVNSVLTTGGKELRLYEVAAYTIHGSHTPNDDFVCSVCGKSALTSVEEALEIIRDYVKNQLSEEYYYVQLTLNNQVNPNGFARATFANGLNVTVAGGYLTGDAEGTLQLGDTVIFKAKLGKVFYNTGETELRLYEVADYKVLNSQHTHVYGQTVTVIVPPTCGTEGTGTVACTCGDTKEVSVPATEAHTPNNDFSCSVCGKSVAISIEEAIQSGMSYEKGKYSNEYYYVQLTLDDQVNDNGFARAFISDGLYVSVAGPYSTSYVNGTIKLGDTVIYKAKLGAVNSDLTVGGKELRLYQVAAFKIVASKNVYSSATLDEKTEIVTYHSSFASLTSVDKIPTGVTLDSGYLYVKKSALASIEKSALVWNTYGKYSNISFDLYVDKVTDKNGNACTEVEFQLSAGTHFVSVVDANGNAATIVYKENSYVVLKKGQSYHIVINVSDALSPTFSFGWNNKACELYFYNFSIEKSKYEYIVDSTMQTIVCKKDGETNGYFAWPTVTKLDGDRLIAVASGFRSGHIGTDGKVVAWYSEDGGKTWSEPEILADTDLDDRDSGVVYWNGKIIVSWFAHSKAYYVNNNASKYTAWANGIDNAYDEKYMGGNYIISEDGGKTWSEIYTMPDGMFTPHGLILNPNGGLTSVGYLKYDKVNKRWGSGIAVRTTNGTMDKNGFIWSDAIVIADANTQYSWDFQEPYGIYNNDGVLIVVMRSASGLYQCELQPGKTQFSDWHKIANVQESPAHMMQHSSGIMIMTYGYRGIYVDENGKTVSYTERNKDTTLGIRARLSYDGGLTWTQEIILSYGLKPTANENTSDWGYTSSVELSDGKILTLFYQRTAGETKASIYQIIWEISSSSTREVTITFVGGKDGGDAKIATIKGKIGETIVLPATPTYPGFKFAGWYTDYACTIPFTATTYSNDLVVYAKWAIDTTLSLPLMSFNVKVTQTSEILSNPRHDLVVNTILDNNPYVFGVQEADPSWMSALKNKLGHLYTAVGEGRNGGTGITAGEYSAIFYRTDMFTCIASGTKWLSATPDKAGSKYSYTEGGTTYTANYPRIMTYVVLQRKSDGAKFIYVNAHLDNNGNNNGTVAENIRKGQVEVLLGEIQKLYKRYGNLPTIVSGDFNTQPNTASYTTMIQSGFVDSSKVAKQGEIKRTFNGNSDSGNVIFDYIFVSSNLANIVQSYNVCPEKRDGKWISDHNAIIANIVIPNK